MRTTALFAATVVAAGLTTGLVGCSGSDDSDDPEDSIIVDDGKADDFFSTTAMEYTLEGKSTVTLDASFATKPLAQRQAAAKKLVGLKQVAIAWFITQY